MSGRKEKKAVNLRTRSSKNNKRTRRTKARIGSATRKSGRTRR